MKQKNKIVRLFLLTLAVIALIGLDAAAAEESEAPVFDIVILNGRVMDPETKVDAVSNVGIKDGKIVKITDEMITGKETIDVVGCTPGYAKTGISTYELFEVQRSTMPMAR